MKKIISLLVLIISVIGYSQNINVLPKDENGKIHFTKIIESNGLTKEKIYNKTKLFFVNNFNSSKDVIQLEDKENSIIVGKGNSILNIRSGKYKFPINMSFTIKLEAKDNKCKIEIYNIYYNNDSPAEMFFNEESENRFNKSKDKTKVIMEDYRDQTLSKINYLESKIIEELSKKDQSW